MITATDCNIIGNSPAIRQLREELEYAARSDAKVLVTGESGVGKEIVSQFLHAHSRRSRGPLVAINCGGLTDTLLESELFGHARGSFTGAHRDKPGKLEMANHGTVFLDEVGEMSLRMQVLLLRFLETGEIQRVGSERQLTRVDVRVIAATNRRLTERIALKEFREDLYYRLNVIHIGVPPLRERREDVPMLVDHFLGVFSRLYRVPRPELSLETLARLQSHDWPGNVRELKNVIERLTVRWRPDMPAADLPFDGPSPSPAAAPKSEPAISSRVLDLHQRMAVGGESFWSAVHDPFMSHDLTRAELQELIRMGLDHTRGSYKILTGMYNIDPSQYKRFMSFLRKHDCHVPFQPFRTAVKAPLKEIYERGRVDSLA
jgi:transcriptional regulator with PAS, ATPase and Fis domain